jgi:Tfp pilus assembly protein PilO
MSTPANATSQKRKASSIPVEPVVIGLLAALCGLAWWGLVTRQQEALDAKVQEADALEAEVAKATQYLRSRPAEDQIRKEISTAAERIKQRVPEGRMDIAVATYLQQRAAAAGLTDFKYDVVGGMALPKEKPDADKPPEERLVLDPDKLLSQVIVLDFTGPYAGFVKFVRGIAEAPWVVEVIQTDLRKDKDRALEGRITVRYYFQ